MSDEKELRKALMLERKNGYERLPEEELEELEAYCHAYKDYLDKGRTERLCSAETVRLAEEQGFRPFVPGEALNAGDKVDIEGFLYWYEGVNTHITAVTKK